MDLPPDFKELLEEFARDAVELALVGGYAVAFHGRPRSTKDIDLVLEGSAENLARAAAALARFGAPTNVVTAVAHMQTQDIVYMGQPPLRIDLMRSIDGVPADSLFQHAEPATLDGVQLKVISLDHLIANKQAAGRPQDLIDVKFLEKIRDRARQP
ncbi:MAG TPA: nucleotidyl transferase AbiEii/AbiGii toxin family protein [Polyangiaceae bacterium]|nr:nucleotidyl transferase AbiEii/AbiGii toxin family protein [Polyangiaceae bacterium]